MHHDPRTPTTATTWATREQAQAAADAANRPTDTTYRWAVVEADGGRYGLRIRHTRTGSLHAWAGARSGF